MYKQGDVLAITFRNGYDKDGQPIMLTLERAEVLGFNDGLLQVTYRDVNDAHDGVEIERVVFNLRTSNALMKQCQTA